MDAFEVLADPTRRAIVEMLTAEEMAAGDIAERFSVSGPAISRHLRVLREAGFVSVRRDGQRRIYVLDPAPLHSANQWMQDHLTRWQERFTALGAHLDRVADANRKARR